MAKTTSSMRLEGADALQQVLKELPEGLQGPVLDSAVRSGAKELAEEVRGWADRSGGGPSHPDIGHLADNIEARKAPKKRRRYDSHYLVHNGPAYWGLFQEFGTANMSADPFMRPGLEAAKDDVTRTIAKRLKKRIETEARKLAGRFGGLGKARTRRLGRS